MRNVLMTAVFGMAVFAGAFAAQAEEPSPKGRFDVNGVQDKVSIEAKSIPEGCHSYNGAAWMPADGECLRIFVFPSSKSSWTKSSFSFVPSKDGEVTLILRGDYFPKEPGSKDLYTVWSYVTDVSVEGAKLANGSFSSQADGKPSGWTLGGDAAYVSDPSILPAGFKGGVKVWHNAAATQNIYVKAGQEVKVSFQHKGE